MLRAIVPYLFLALLVVVLTFILGVRYGKRVEQINKTISYLISITPQPKPTDTGYRTYKLAKCGASFLYPTNLAVEEATVSASFAQDGTTQLSVSCNKNKLAYMRANSATEEAIFKNQKIVAEVKQVTGGIHLVFDLKNPQNPGYPILSVDIDKRLYPLFESSLQLGAPATP